MPLQTQLVGQCTSPRHHAVDTRWTMAYAAGLQDENPRLRDTTQASLCVHPLFPVCLEWPSVLDSRALPGHDGLSDDELARGVHATHDLHVIKPIVPGQLYKTTARVVDLQAGQQGARVCLQLDTYDEAGDLVTRTWQTNVSRGVTIEGPAATPIAQAPAWSDIILHGTASLALSVTALSRELLDGAVDQVIRLGGRFTSMVLMPQTLTLHITAQGSDWALFELRNDVQAPVIKDGFMVWSQASATAII